MCAIYTHENICFRIIVITTENAHKIISTQSEAFVLRPLFYRYQHCVRSIGLDNPSTVK